MSFIINLLVSALVVFGLANILPGVSIKGYVSAILVALVIGLLNAVVRPILSFISIPVTIIFVCNNGYNYFISKCNNGRQFSCRWFLVRIIVWCSFRNRKFNNWWNVRRLTST